MTWLAGLAVAGVLALSACGGTTTPAETDNPAATQTQAELPSSEEVITNAMEEMRTAQSVRIHLVGPMEGKQSTVDIAGNREGTNQRTELKLDNDGGHAEIITVDGKDYIKADRAFWTSQDPAAGAQTDLLEGKYIGTGEASFSRDMNVGTLLDEAAAGDLSLQDKLNTKVEEDTVDGTPAYKLSSRVGGDGTVVWTTADDKNQILKVTDTDENGEHRELTFSDWNAVETFETPPADQILQL
ncbi:MAG: hypothetical protein Q4F67_03285 [Propionibacteriaceae bacterium]|nr:hypothetical protein [Propionibacteriaceae bacterium]